MEGFEDALERGPSVGLRRDEGAVEGGECEPGELVGGRAVAVVLEGEGDLVAQPSERYLAHPSDHGVGDTDIRGDVRRRDRDGLEGETKVMDSPPRFSIRLSRSSSDSRSGPSATRPARSHGWRKSLGPLWATAVGTIPQ
jgi:hypothetical protein